MWKRKKSSKKDKKNLATTIPPDSPNSKEIGKEKIPIVIEEENEVFETPRSQLDHMENEGSTLKDTKTEKRENTVIKPIVTSQNTDKNAKEKKFVKIEKTTKTRNDIVDNEKTPEVRNDVVDNEKTPTDDVDNEKTLNVRNVVDSEKAPKTRNDVDDNEKIPKVRNDVVDSEKAPKVSTVNEVQSSNEEETKVVPLANEDTNTDDKGPIVKNEVDENKRIDAETKNEDPKVKGVENFPVVEDEQNVPISEVPKVIETTKEIAVTVGVDENMNKLNEGYHKNSDGFNGAKDVDKSTSEAEKTEILGRNEVDRRSTMTRRATICNCCGLLDVLTSSDR